MKISNTCAVALGWLVALASGQLCPSNTALVSIQIKFDGSPNENNVAITNYAISSLSTDLNIPKTAFATVDVNTCVPKNELHEITLRDSNGNGLGSDGYMSVSINDRLVATLNNFGSSVSYFFIADSNSCEGVNDRFVMNLKHDNFPNEVLWSLYDESSNAVVIDQAAASLGGVLASEFLYVDQCIPPGSYTFTVSDTTSDGIATPGFWRVFVDYNLIGVGGGDLGFQQSESVGFVVLATDAPTPSPTPDICDDSTSVEFFVPSTGMTEPCIWLAARPSEQSIFCQPDHPSGAYDICEETCGKCSDKCEDDPTISFVFNGITRDCAWLEIRPALWPAICVEGSDAYNGCNESCESCGDSGLPSPPSTPFPVSISTPPPTSAPTPSPTPAPTRSPTPAPTPSPIGAATPFPTTVPTDFPTKWPTTLPTEFPSLPPAPVALIDTCDDSMTERFFVSDEVGSVPCVWLADRPTEQPTYCAPTHPSGAFDICEETCGKCSDSCEDDPWPARVEVEGIQRPCSWLALRPSKQTLVCVNGNEAITVCKETCGNCGERRK